MLEVKFYDTVDDSLLKFAVIISQSNGKWVFCKHKERDTYEVPGGHREAGENILETAKRELQEETGAIKFEIKPICVYLVTGKTRVNDTGEETFGQLCFAEITEFAKELHSEMEKVVLMDDLPENWTYPLIQPKLIEEWERREKGEMQMRILVIGGTRYFGIHMVNKLLEQGHAVTIATRGKTPDSYGDKVERITIQRTNEESMREALQGKHFDVVIDKIAYCSNDIRYVMDYVDCDKYIYMSSTSVYNPKHMNTVESDFDGYSKDFVWCDRKEFPYEQIKRQAEYALWQKYPGKNWIAVRYPFAIGKDDYTKRLLFYVEHVIKSEPMYIDNIDYQMSYIRSDEAGEFIAYLVDKDVKGAINGSASETISLREVINYIEEKTGKCAALSEQGEAAPYNGEPEYSINTDKADKTGYRFSNLKDWIYELLDYYIEQVDKAECKEE